jgi:hypothetical protein
MTNAIKVVLQMQSGFLQLESTIHPKADSSCKKPLVICNSIFSILLNQIKAQRGHKFIVWIEYFPYKYSLKVISNY